MKKQKSKIFLYISLAVFAFTVIAIVAGIALEYYQIQTDFADDVRMANDLTASLAIVAVFLIFPILAVELSCIRSVYKLLQYEPSGIVKICYLISAIISFLAFSLQFLMIAGAVDVRAGIKETVLFSTEWPIFIVSFLLGSTPIKRKASAIKKTINEPT